MIKYNTHWSSPKRTLLAGLNSLRQALASGERAKLVRLANEDCSYPIKVKNSITDFRAYEFSIGLLKTRQQIEQDDTMPEFEKHLTLNYKSCYGTRYAVDRYYQTGQLCVENFEDVGISHLVAVKDRVKFFRVTDKPRAEMFQDQYFGETTGTETHFFDHYRLKPEHDIYTIKRFKTKLWVVALLRDTETMPRIPVLVHILNTVSYPLKYIPKRSVLKMDEYKCVTYRIGAVVHGFSIEFHIPKKFSFSNRD